MKKTILLLTILISALTAASQEYPDWLKTSVFYQIYPSSFQDSDGNGIGDIEGIRSRLDYLVSLGVNALWLNPVFVSAFGDGGYDVIDFYQVDPRFGTNSGLIEFVEDAHSRGMHVVLDLVAGHSSIESEWFIQSMKADPNLRYSDYYIWTDEKPDDLSEQEASRWVEANAPRGKYYIKNFFDIQPALNYGYANPNPDHPWEQSVHDPGPKAVRRELQNIITFWLEKGIDGFRVDLARTLVKNDPDQKATIELWQDLNAWFDEEFPEGVLIAEWFNPKQSIAAYFDVDFLRSSLFQTPRGARGIPEDSMYFHASGKGSIEAWDEYFTYQYEATLGKGYISLPTGNHDTPRLANGDRNTPEELKTALTFLLTQPGIPVIYYGDEIGMRYIPGSPSVEGSGMRSGTRTPMQWDQSSNAGFSSAQKDAIYIPQDPDPNRPTVAEQENDPNSLLSYVKGLLKLRASSEALGNEGEWDFLSDPAKPYPMVYLRKSGNERYLIAINPSNKSVKASIPSQNATSTAYVYGSITKYSFKNGKAEDVIKLPGMGAVILKIE